MQRLVEAWLESQRQRQWVLILDPLADPDPVAALYAAGIAENCANLYVGTEFVDLAPAAAWVAIIPSNPTEFLDDLLSNPQRQWGWLASSDADLSGLVRHWQERMLVDSGTQRSLYRLQDSRVISRHLECMSHEQRPLLLGPLRSALCWNGEAWRRFDNPAPAHYPAPFTRSWLTLPEPLEIAEAIRQHNLQQWLWQTYPAETAQLAETTILEAWLHEQLAKAKQWLWNAPEQVQFLLARQLIPELAEHPAWRPEEGESPARHFNRCQLQITATEPRT